MTLSGNIDGPFALSKVGAGSLTLTGPASTYSGGMNLDAGTLVLGSTTALGATAGTFAIGGGTTLNSNVANLVNANNNAVAINGDFTFTGTQSLNLGTGAVTLGGAAGSRQITASANALTFGGVISDGTATGLTKAGAGTLVLGANNVYTGTTAINAGTLQIGTGGTTGSIGTTLGIVNNGVFATNRSDTITQSTLFGNVSGTGGFTKLGTGTTILDGINTYTGTTSVNAGILRTTGSVTPGPTWGRRTSAMPRAPAEPFTSVARAATPAPPLASAAMPPGPVHWSSRVAARSPPRRPIRRRALPPETAVTEASSSRMRAAA